VIGIYEFNLIISNRMFNILAKSYIFYCTERGIPVDLAHHVDVSSKLRQISGTFGGPSILIQAGFLDSFV